MLVAYHRLTRSLGIRGGNITMEKRKKKRKGVRVYHIVNFYCGLLVERKT